MQVPPPAGSSPRDHALQHHAGDDAGIGIAPRLAMQLGESVRVVLPRPAQCDHASHARDDAPSLPVSELRPASGALQPAHLAASSQAVADARVTARICKRRREGATRMKALVTGSSGHLGEALVRTLHAAGHAVVGLDVLAAPFTDHLGSITDRGFVARHARASPWSSTRRRCTSRMWAPTRARPSSTPTSPAP